MTAEIDKTIDEWAILKAAWVYAAGADRKDKELWRTILADDYVLEAQHFTMVGLEENLKSIDILGQMFEQTQHKVHNQLMQIEGDRATGETYCTAEHIRVVDGKREILSWSIRYQDELSKIGGNWMFKKRTLIVDWEEVRPLS